MCDLVLGPPCGALRRRLKSIAVPEVCVDGDLTRRGTATVPRGGVVGAGGGQGRRGRPPGGGQRQRGGQRTRRYSAWGDSGGPGRRAEVARSGCAHRRRPNNAFQPTTHPAVAPSEAAP